MSQTQVEGPALPSRSLGAWALVHLVWISAASLLQLDHSLLSQNFSVYRSNTRQQHDIGLELVLCYKYEIFVGSSSYGRPAFQALWFNYHAYFVGLLWILGYPRKLDPLKIFRYTCTVLSYSKFLELFITMDGVSWYVLSTKYLREQGDVRHDRFDIAIVFFFLYLFVYLHVPFGIVDPGVVVELITDGILYVIA